MASFQHDHVVPYQDSRMSKKEQVAALFNKIAFRYDFLNRLLSGGIDVRWRRKAIQELRALQPQKVLDVATGTADVALMTWKMLRPSQIIGIDISENMLSLGRQKISRLKLQDHLTLYQGDSEAINYPGGTFDAVTVAFGVRNFEHLETGLQEIYRVLRSGGKLVVLEFSRPRLPVFRKIYDLYMKHVAPKAGSWISRDQAAYQYLNNSIKAFPEGETFLHILRKNGFTQTYLKRLSLGICTIYCAIK